MKPSKLALLFFIIFIEGYVVLSCELLTIRELIPFVGSGTDTVSIIISAVLMPLAVGYHRGGQALKRTKRSARSILLKNILYALAILGIGLSYPFMNAFFTLLTAAGVSHRLAQTTIYCLLFTVWPVFVLGQTVPLVSNYFSRQRISEITGKMLFFSTTGSFVGSVFSTLVLMMWLGVHITVVITMGLLFLLIPLLSRRFLSSETITGAVILSLVVMLNSSESMRNIGVVSNNDYNLAMVGETNGVRYLTLNHSNSSAIGAIDPESYKFNYIRYIDDNFLKPLQAANPPRDILVIGAGGFTMGLSDTINHYTFVDIDKDLLKIAEENFLKAKLTPNKHFVPASARAFVHGDTHAYDLVIIDVYTNIRSIPMETVTQEFLQEVKRRLKPDGIVIANVHTLPNMGDRFSVRYSNTFLSVFPHATRQLFAPYNAWAGTGGIAPLPAANALYIYYNNSESNDLTVYTDDKNTWALDRK